MLLHLKTFVLETRPNSFKDTIASNNSYLTKYLNHTHLHSYPQSRDAIASKKWIQKYLVSLKDIKKEMKMLLLVLVPLFVFFLQTLFKMVFWHLMTPELKSSSCCENF